MERRRFIGTIASVSISGCTGISGNNANTETMNLIPPNDPLSKYDCPRFQELSAADDSIDTTMCIRGGDANDEIKWTVTEQTLSGPSESTTFTIENGTGQRIEINPANWRTSVLTESGWKFLAPDSYQEIEMTLKSGESQSWKLSLGTDVRSTDVAKVNGPAKTRAPGAGIYLFRVLVDSQGTTTAYVGLLKYVDQ